MENVLELEGLDKRYGKVHAVRGVSLQIQKGWIYGLLGPNGSGKTTTLGMILDVIQPSGGTYSWYGKPPSTEQLKHIGAILESPLFYPFLSGERNLKIVAEIKGVSYQRIEEVLVRVGLQDRRKSEFKTYSLGMKQRLAIAAALLSDPDVLILDEPTNGLDPQGIAEIRQLILEIAKEGKTIILASHLLDEVEKVCTHVGVLKKGELLFSGPANEILGKRGETQVILQAEDSDKLELVVSNWEAVQMKKKENGRYYLSHLGELTGAQVNRYFYEKGVVLSHLELRTSSLEEQFLQLLGKKA